MKIVHSLSQIDQMESYLEEIEVINQKKKELSEEERQIREIWQVIYDKYGNKLERIRKPWRHPVSQAEIDQLKASVFDESIVTRLKRFLGLRQKQLDEYNDLMDRLDFLKSHNEEQLGEVNGQLDEKEERWSEYLEKYADSYRKIKKMYSDSQEQDWKSYVQPEEEQTFLYLGDLTADLETGDEAAEQIHEKIGNAWENDQIKCPCLFDLEQSVKLGIIYENEQQKDQAQAVIRSIICQVIRQYPLYRYQFTCLDYKGSGSSLRELRKLEEFVDTYAEGIKTDLFQNRYQMLTVSATESAIADTLSWLEDYIDEVSRTIGGKETIYEYNKGAEEKIPILFLLINDFPEGLGDNGLKKLQKILLNSERCGICVILSVSRFYENNLEELMKNAGIKRHEYGMICCGQTEGELVFDVIRGPFFINDMHMRMDQYVESLLALLDAGKNIDNHFEAIFDKDGPLGQMDSTEFITVPFSVTPRGRIGEIRLGSVDIYANALLSGRAGSGKSTLLHMLINSIMMNYTPEDVELWLVDYKMVEFYLYTKNTPPHIKFIGLDTSSEFSFAFIDHMRAELKRRLELFKASDCSNIVDYKKRFGKDSLARVVVIIDEFHVMTNQIQGTDYAVKLEEFLKEARAAGMICVFSDQVVSVGLRGLTEAGRMQITVRLAMANDDIHEIKEALAMADSKNVVIEQMARGEVTVKRAVEERNKDGQMVRTTRIDKEKVIYISDEMRDYMCSRIYNEYPKKESPIVIDGSRRVMADWNAIEKFDEEKRAEGRPGLHLGIPSNLDRCFCIDLRRNYGQNVISVGDNTDLQASILFHSIESFKRQKKYKIYIMADNGDDIYLKYESQLRKMEKEENIYLLDDYARICQTVDQLHQEMYSRRRRQSEEDILVLWLGLDNMALEFSYYPNKKAVTDTSKPKATVNTDNLMDSMGSMFDKLFETDDFSAQKETDAKTDANMESETETEEDMLYNATEDIGELTMEGPKRGIFHFILLPSVLPLKKLRFIKLENFVNKIGFQMDDDSSVDYFGKTRMTKDLSPQQAIYYNGGVVVRTFLPYLLPWQE